MGKWNLFNYVITPHGRFTMPLIGICFPAHRSTKPLFCPHRSTLLVCHYASLSTSGGISSCSNMVVRGLSDVFSRRPTVYSPDNWMQQRWQACRVLVAWWWHGACTVRSLPLILSQYPQPCKPWTRLWMRKYIGLSALSDVNSGSSSTNDPGASRASSLPNSCTFRSSLQGNQGERYPCATLRLNAARSQAIWPTPDLICPGSVAPHDFLAQCTAFITAS